MLKMVIAAIVVLLFAAVCSAASPQVPEKCTVDIIRKIDVIVEVGPTEDDHLVATVDGLGFFESLLGNATDKRCWDARITVVDSAEIEIKSFECKKLDCMVQDWITTNDKNKKTPRQNVIGILNDISTANDGNLARNDYPPVIVLILSNYDRDVEKLEIAANDLLEVGYKFVAVGLGEDDDTIRRKKWGHTNFTNLASQSGAIIVQDSLYSLDPYNDVGSHGRLLDLFSDPDSEGPRIGAYSTQGDATKTCDVTVDLGFVLDSSGSLKEQYDREKHFMKMIAKAFNVKRGGTHAGVVTFSDKAKLSIKLSDTSNYGNFHEAVNNIGHMDSITRIDLALKTAKDQLFSAENGGRKDKKKVLVVLTDGSQTYGNLVDKSPLDPVPIADQLRKQGIELLVIGIGNRVKEDELKRLAGPKDNYRQAKDFEELTSRQFARNMTTKLCDIVKSGECEKIVDLCFLIDSSGSISKNTDWVTIKEFVRRLSNVFQFSETGARGSVVVFSDKIGKNKAYTKVAIRLDNGLSASDFGRKIENTPYIGYRTRIDLGFNLIEKEVFIARNGARPNIKKVIVLITDGRQNPKQYDPVAASDDLYNDNVNIYAIGIGKQIDFDQLNRITRQPHRVFKADTFKSLENIDFVNSVSQTVCKAATVIPEFKTKCCCPNIDDTIKASMGKKLVDVVKKEIGEYCENKCSKKSEKGKFEGVVGKPAIAPNPMRKRRSINIDNGENDEFKELGMLGKLSKVAGCNIFLNALRRYGILRNISSLMKENKHVSIFCPIDGAYEKLYTRQDLADNERNILLNHVGLKHEKYGRVYRTLLSGGQIVFNAVGKESGKVLWKANDAGVVVSLADGVGSEIVVVNDIILPTKRNLLDVLKSNNNISIFYDLLVKSQLPDIFKNTEIEKICFTQDMCLSVTPAMFNQLKAAVNLNQFTICAPTNNMLLNMKKSQLKFLMTDQAARKEFLQEYVFLGSLGNPASKEVAYSLSTKHFVLTTKMVKNTMFLKHADGRKFEVKDTIVATEGIVHVIEMTK